MEETEALKRRKKRISIRSLSDNKVKCLNEFISKCKSGQTSLTRPDRALPDTNKKGLKGGSTVVLNIKVYFEI